MKSIFYVGSYFLQWIKNIFSSSYICAVLNASSYIYSICAFFFIKKNIFFIDLQFILNICVYPLILHSHAIYLTQKSSHLQQKQKRFYTRGTLKSIMIPRLTKIPTLYRDCLRSLEVREGLIFWVASSWMVKTFTVVHKMPRFLLIYSKISFTNTIKELSKQI